MKTKQEIQKWILENCVDDNGYIDLIGLDFGDKIVYLSEMKAYEIHQNGHKADRISQSEHKADLINQHSQKARIIWQETNEAKEISQSEHKCDNVKDGKHISTNEMTLEEAEKKFNIKIVK